MKTILLAVIYFIFCLPTSAQSNIANIQYHVSGLDTSYEEQQNQTEVEMIITEQVTGVKSYNGEAVYKEYEVSGLEQNLQCIIQMQVAVSQAFRKYRRLIGVGKYTFGLGWATISKMGELVSYYLILPEKFPFINYEEKENAQEFESMIATFEKDLSQAIEKNKIWTAGTKNGEAVHAYFDEPIEFSIEIK